MRSFCRYLLSGDGEGVLVLVVEVLLQIEESVEEDVDELDFALEVDESHKLGVDGMDEIQHLAQQVLKGQRLDAHRLQSSRTWEG